MLQTIKLLFFSYFGSNQLLKKQPAMVRVEQDQLSSPKNDYRQYHRIFRR